MSKVADRKLEILDRKDTNIFKIGYLTHGPQYYTQYSIYIFNLNATQIWYFGISPKTPLHVKSDELSKSARHCIG